MSAKRRPSSTNGAISVFWVGIVLTLPLAAWAGFAAHVLWGWFAIPLGLPAVGVWEAAGLNLLVRLWTYDSRDVTTNESTPWAAMGRAFWIGVLVPAFFLAFGALYHGLS